MNQKYKVLVFSDWKHCLFAALNDLERHDRSRRNSYRSHKFTNRCPLNRWNAGLLVLCCVALSGCGSSFTLNSPLGALISTPTTVSFGSVTVGQEVSTSVSVLNKGTAPIRLSKLGVSGQSFSVAGKSTLPVTLGVGETYMLDVKFNPMSAGAATGQLSISTNSSATPTAAVSLSGTGTAGEKTDIPALSVNTTSVSFGSVTVGQTSKQSVTLTSSGTAPVTISAVSIVGSLFSASGVAVPLTLHPGQTATLNLQFYSGHVSSFTGTLTVSSNSSQGNVVVNMSGAGTSASNPVVSSSLGINATSVAFGNVVINNPATQTVILTSTGTAAVTVKAATLTGTGFTLSGDTFPLTLNPSQTATLNVKFDPTTAGSKTGQLAITSNSSNNSAASVSLSGTGVTAAHEVQLSWDAPSSSGDPVAGYHIYRATGSSTSYQKLNSSEDTGTSYVDTTVQGGQAYDYVVKSVDSSGKESGPSNKTDVTIP